MSTPSDLILLGEAAMRIPVFSQIVSLGQTTLPLAGLHYNANFDLGKDGIVGIAAGADTAANGCFLFAAKKTVNGQTITLYGAVLGQSGPNGPDTAAVDAGDALVKAALAAITAVPVVAAGHVVGDLSAPWGASAPVVVAGPVTVAAWPGLSVALTARLDHVTGPLAAGSKVGVLRVREGSYVITAAFGEHRIALGTLCVLAPHSLRGHRGHEARPVGGQRPSARTPARRTRSPYSRSSSRSADRPSAHASQAE